jgi:dipeptidyl aminopeptidase/acylaminoacyl peptidase
MLGRLFLIGVAIIATFNAAGAGERTPLQLSDVYRQESITDFRVSPRGDEAVYVRNWYDHSQPGRRSAIWRIDGETGRAEPLEPGEPDGRMPTYSPDGQWLAFVSSRPYRDWKSVTVPAYSDPTGSVWRISRGKHREGGSDEPAAELVSWGTQVLTDSFYGRLSFSPDSKQFAFVAGFQPLEFLGAPAAPKPKFEDQGEGYEEYFPAKLKLGHVAEMHLASYSPLRPSDEFWEGDLQWMPDGKQLVFHSNRTSDQESVRYSINKNYDLWRLQTSDVVNWSRRDAPAYEQLTTNPGPDVSPRISPDGKHVLYLSVPRKGPHMDVFNLCVLALDEQDAKPRTLIHAHDAERSDDGTPPFQPTFPLRDDSWIDDSHVRVRGVRGMKTETLVFHIAGEDHPIAAHAKPEPEPPANKKLKQPAANAWLNERLHAREEIVKWKSFDGLEIEGVLTLPPDELEDYEAPYPLIVHPHGGPHSASKPGFNFTVHLFAAHGYAVFQPNFRGTYGYGRKFLDAARFDMGGSDMQDILTGIDMLIKRGTVDKKRQFVYGISYGGYSTCRLVTLTKQFRAAAAQNAVTDLHAMWSLSDLQSWTEWEFGGKPWETVEHEGRKIDVGKLMRERSPTTLAHTVTTPTLILHADHDRRCPVAMGRMFYRGLKESGCETEMVIYSEERHGLWQVKHQADVLERVLAWFARHDLKKSEEETAK